ncbi:leucyl aminopeptidase [Pseudomonas sp. ICMP 460]|uniref:leucyl aminopeptidase n=1 Tax=Pseudomonas sp. ICMP 460 TaxID=1718917 RepID=UPI000C08145E|nr:leucyl aminopeptidase [Pseudomonas sp. ICMP 460]PHN24786.1 aminopeptidase [Pseudomonas sp. ICMP 460]
MNFVLTQDVPDARYLAEVQTECLVLGINRNDLSGAAKAFDHLTDGLLRRVTEADELESEIGKTLLLHAPRGLKARRVLLVSLGKSANLTQQNLKKALGAGADALKISGCSDAVWCLSATTVTVGDECQVLASVLALRDAYYTFGALKSSQGEKRRPLDHVRLMINGAHDAAEASVLRGVAIADGLDLCRDLGNLPPNICTPTYLAESALTMADQFPVEVQVMDQEQIAALGMNAFLAVAQGSAQPPRFIVIRHNGAQATQAPVVLVGKGITFDSGGISLKPGDAMDEMKYDMCGAAAVIGTLRAAAQMKLGLNVIGVIAACENMPGPNALKPGDVITSMLGKTIEVLNTDAEGRLILCDALTYSERFEPAAVIDVATLTGACIVALGHVHSGLYASDEALGNEVLQAAHASGDSAWRMPLDEAYQEQLKSNFADLPNIGTKGAGSVTAACFLSHFATRYPWAHLDVAGTAWRSGPQKGATGRPVRLLTELLISRAHSTQL